MAKPSSVKPLQTYGRLTVVEPTDPPNRVFYRKGSWFLCDCACGTKGVKVLGGRLTSGNTRSCGCLRSENGKAFIPRKRERDMRWVESLG